MVETIPQTQTPVYLTTFETTAITRIETVPQAVTSSEGALELSTLTSTSIDQTTNSSEFNTQTSSRTRASSQTQTSISIQTSTSTRTPTSRQLSTTSVVGIALGSVVAAVLLVLCLLFAFGFRIKRAKWQRKTTITEAPKLWGEHSAAAPTSGGPYGKAELADAEYTRRLERLQDGAKPELEGSRVTKSVWGVFSIRSASKRGTRQVAAELGTEPLSSGPHELPGDDVLKSTSQEPREAKGARDVRDARDAT